MRQQAEYSLHPTWWNGQENTAWERVQEALKRDWDQTKADLSLSQGRDLDQSVRDTVRQALGKDPLPLPSQRTPRHGIDLDAGDDDHRRQPPD